MAKATALARARRVRQHPKPKPQSAQIGPDGPQHPGNRQLYDKRGRPDAGLRLHPHHATFNVATFCAALWSNFTLPLTTTLSLIATGSFAEENRATLTAMLSVAGECQMLIFSEEERIARIRQSQREYRFRNIHRCREREREYRARNIHLCRERIRTWEAAHREERCLQKRELYRKKNELYMQKMGASKFSSQGRV